MWTAASAILGVSLSAGLPGPPPEIDGASAPAPVSFTWCGGTLTLELDTWGNASGAMSVFGWSYLYWDSHSLALRVDGAAIYSPYSGTGTASLPLLALSANPAARTASSTHQVHGLARVTTRYYGLEEAGCCSLKVVTEVTNLGRLPHSFEWRWYHDTAYKRYQTCPTQTDPDVDGGEVCLPGEVPTVSCRTREFDARAAGAVGCGQSLRFYSSDTGALGPVFVFDDRINRPSTLEVLSWEADATDAGRRWSGFVNGENVAGCTGDNSVLAVWRLPPGSGDLDPLQSARSELSIGHGCTVSCCALTADAGADRTICAGESTILGGNPVIVGGQPPFHFQWLPDDGSLDDPTRDRPTARPGKDTLYRLEAGDALGCAAAAEVVVSVIPERLPGSAGNTLLLVERPGAVELSWQPAPLALSHTLRGDPDKRFVAPAPDREDIPGSSLLLPVAPTLSRMWRIHGASCSGQLGP